MLSLPRLALCSSLGLGLAACGQQQVTPQADLGQVQAAIVASWVSQGADLAPLLSGPPLNLTKITAAFADSTYEVTAIDNKGSQTIFKGTYVTAGSGDILEITLNQSQPATVVSKGIYKIDASATPARMTYEVAQVQPDIKVTPPTVSGGFGSTSNGAFMMNNVQKYSKSQ